MRPKTGYQEKVSEEFNLGMLGRSSAIEFACLADTRACVAKP
jgi:hypothetical protein